MATPIAKTQIKVRRSPYSEWTASRANVLGADFLPVADGEITYDTTNNQIRIGNGVDKWEDLPFFSPFVTEPLRITSFSGYGTILYVSNLTAFEVSTPEIHLYRQSRDGSTWSRYGTSFNTVEIPTGSYTLESNIALESGYSYRIQLASATATNVVSSQGVPYRPITFNNYSNNISLLLNKASRSVSTKFTIQPTFLEELRLFLLLSDNSDFTNTTDIAGPITITRTQTEYDFTTDVVNFEHGKYFYAEFRATNGDVLSRFNGTTVPPFRYNVPYLIVLDFPTYNTVRVEYNRDLSQTYTGNHTIRIYNAEDEEVPTTGNVITDMDIITQTYTLTKTSGAFSVGSYKASLFNTESTDVMPSQISTSYTPITISDFAITDSNGWSVTSTLGTNPPSMRYAIYELDNSSESLADGALEDSNIPINTVSDTLTSIFFTTGKFYEIIAYPQAISTNFFTHVITSRRLTSALSLGVPTFPEFTILNNVVTVRFILGTNANVVYSTNPAVTFRTRTVAPVSYGSYTAALSIPTAYTNVSTGATVSAGDFVVGTIYRATITYVDFIPTGTYAASIFGGAVITTDYPGVYQPFTTFSITSTAITQTTVAGTITGPSTRTNIRYKLFRQTSGVGTFIEISGITSSLTSNTFTLTLPSGTILAVGDNIYVTANELGKTTTLQSTEEVEFVADGVVLDQLAVVDNSSVSVRYNITTATVFNTTAITLRLYERNVFGTLLGTSAGFLFSNVAARSGTVTITPTVPLDFGKRYTVRIEQSGGSLGSITLTEAYSPITIGTIVPYDKRHMKVPLTFTSAKNFSSATLRIYKIPAGGSESQVASQNLTTSNETDDYVFDMGAANEMDTASSVSYNVKILVGSTDVSTSSSITLSSGSFAPITTGSTVGGTTTYMAPPAIDALKCFYTYSYTATAVYPINARPRFALRRSLDGGSTYTTVSFSSTYTTRTVASNGSESSFDYNSTSNNNRFIPVVSGGRTTSRLTTTDTLREGLYVFQILDYDNNQLSNSSADPFFYYPFTIRGFSFGNYYTLFNLTLESRLHAGLYTGLTDNLSVAIFTSAGTRISSYSPVTNRGNVATSYQLRNTADTANTQFTNNTSYYAVVFYNRGTDSVPTYNAVTIQSATMPFRRAFMTVTDFTVASFTTNRTRIVYTINFTNTNNDATVIWFPNFRPLVGRASYSGGTYTYTVPDQADIVPTAGFNRRTSAQLVDNGEAGFTPALNTPYTMTLRIPTITSGGTYLVSGIDLWQASIATGDLYPDRVITSVQYSPTAVTSLNSVDRSGIYSRSLGFTCNLVGNSSPKLKFTLTNTTISGSTITVFENIEVNTRNYGVTSTPHTIEINDTDSGVATSYLASGSTVINIGVPAGSPGMVDGRFIVSNDYTLRIGYDDISTTVTNEQTYSPIGYDVIVLAGQSNMYGCDGLTDGVTDPSMHLTSAEVTSMNDGKVEVYSMNGGGEHPDYGSYDPVFGTIFTSDSPGGVKTSFSYYFSPRGRGQNTTWEQTSGDGAQSNTISMGQEFVKHYKDYVLATNRKVIVIPAQKGNTGFENNGYETSGETIWAIGGSLRDQTLSALNICMTLGGSTNYNRLAAFLWHQGEYDSQWGRNATDTNTNNWVTNLNRFIYGTSNSDRSVWFRLPANAKTFPFILGEMLPTWSMGGNYLDVGVSSNSTRYSHHLNKVGILGFDDTRPMAKSVSAAGLHGTGYLPERGDYSIHMSNRTERLMGLRYFQAFRVLSPYTRVTLPSAFNTFNINVNQQPSSVTVTKTGSEITEISWAACTVSWNDAANASCYLLQVLNASNVVMQSCLITQYYLISDGPRFDRDKIPFSWDGDQVGCWIPHILTSVNGNCRTFSNSLAFPTTQTITISLNGTPTTYSSIPVYYAGTTFNTNSLSTSGSNIFNTRNTIRFNPAGFLGRFTTTGMTQVRVYSVVWNGTQFETVTSTPVAIPP